MTNLQISNLYILPLNLFYLRFDVLNDRVWTFWGFQFKQDKLILLPAFQSSRDFSAVPRESTNCSCFFLPPQSLPCIQRDVIDSFLPEWEIRDAGVLSMGFSPLLLVKIYLFNCLLWNLFWVCAWQGSKSGVSNELACFSKDENTASSLAVKCGFLLQSTIRVTTHCTMKHYCSWQ